MKHYYLQVMGIETWRLRSREESVYYLYKLYNSRGELIGVLLADALFQNEEERKLVEAIANATKMHVEGGLEQEISRISNISKRSKVFILLGKQVAKLFSFNDNVSVIKTHSPAELLENKKLKAVVWKELQVAMKMMKG